MSDDRPYAHNSTLRVARKPIRRKTPLRPVNRERKKRRKERGEIYGPYHDYISRFPCIVENMGQHVCEGDVVGHHVRHVNGGGKDVDNEIPCCHAAHFGELHRHGRKTFEDRYGLDLEKEALKYGDYFRAGVDPDSLRRIA